MNERGVDLSSYQRGLAVRTLKEHGFRFAILKVSDGRTLKDPLFAAFCAEAEGLPLGAYAYCYAATPQRAVEEANAALDAIAGRPLPLGVYMDVETPEQMRLGAAQLEDTVRAFCQTVEAAGYRSGIYGSELVLWAHLDAARFPQSMIWVASWGRQPRMACDLWQSSDRGRVPGYGGPVDTDECLSARFAALLGDKAEPPAERPPAPGTFTLAGVPLLKAGDSGGAVKALQGELIAFGYRCGGRIVNGAEIPDGIFGAQTRASVAAFQTARGLAADGVAGQDTRGALLGIRG